ncbi:MAG: hypothetical protein RMM08_09245, partial [Armatimonadota bacterium]|nr:hypothetical protein [bacterium]MDW8321537.1 hypothetical protein [Armatimonadota bacterium]
RYPIHIPRQDRNRTFSGKPLRHLSSLDDVPSFTYSDLVQRASTVDVIWFSKGSDYMFPERMFEIEHTTDFHNSLIKFRHFVYFSAEFFIVAPGHRERDFREKLERDHRDLRERVKFVNYETLVKLYTKDLERQQAYKEAGIVPL